MLSKQKNPHHKTANTAITNQPKRHPMELVFFFFCCPVFILYLCWFIYSFFNDSGRGKNIEGYQYANYLKRFQVEYFHEHQTFAKNLDELWPGIPSEKFSYQLLIETTPQAAFIYSIPLKNNNKSYVAGVFINQRAKNSCDNAINCQNTITVICEANKEGKDKPAAPVYQNGKVNCGAETHNKDLDSCQSTQRFEVSTDFITDHTKQTFPIDYHIRPELNPKHSTPNPIWFS